MALIHTYFSDFEVKVDKIHCCSKKSTLALFSAILRVKVDFSFWHLNALIHYFEKILGSKWKNPHLELLNFLKISDANFWESTFFKFSDLKVDFI